MSNPENEGQPGKEQFEASNDYAQMFSDANAEASRGVEGEKEASPETAPLPEGWTYLIHGTDTQRWDTSEEVVTVTRSGLSCITSEDAASDAYDTTGGYASPRAEGAQAVEIRVPFYREDFSLRRGARDDIKDIKAGLDPETLALITKYHQDRHAVIPRHERLIRLGEEQAENGRIIEYMIPASVADQYRDSVKQEFDRDL
jgi:hypothetical protein